MSETHDTFEKHGCDLCGSADAVEVPHVREYGRGHPVHICNGCGLVYVPERRSAEAVAATWNNEFKIGAYNGRIPARLSRSVYVAETLDCEFGISGAAICDIGSGEGEFATLLRDRYGAKPFAIDPSGVNCKRMRDEKQLECFQGTVEDYRYSSRFKQNEFNFATMLFSLEGCSSPNSMLSIAHSLLAEDGCVAVVTGSRIMVPFKKPLDLFWGNDEFRDKNSVHFSYRTLAGFLAKHGFEVVFKNRYLDSDLLCVVGRKVKNSRSVEPSAIGREMDYCEDPEAVIDFFRRWHRESNYYKKDAEGLLLYNLKGNS